MEKKTEYMQRLPRTNDIICQNTALLVLTYLCDLAAELIVQRKPQNCSVNVLQGNPACQRPIEKFQGLFCLLGVEERMGRQTAQRLPRLYFAMTGNSATDA